MSNYSSVTFKTTAPLCPIQAHFISLSDKYQMTTETQGSVPLPQYRSLSVDAASFMLPVGTALRPAFNEHTPTINVTRSLHAAQLLFNG